MRKKSNADNAKVMRASKIGFPCDRNLWYAVNGYDEEISERTRRIFAVGTALEGVVVEFLREDGWEVEHNPGSQEAELELRIPVKGGFLAGHPDCVISRPGGDKILVDIKTMNERAFTFWKRDGTAKDKPQYMDQVHVYGCAAMDAGIPVSRLGIVAINKNNSDIGMDFFDFDLERMGGIIERTERVFAAREPPEPGGRMEDWCCSYCGYAEICDIAKAKSKPAKVGEGVLETDDPDLITALEQLKEGRELSRTGKALEETAKAVLDEKVKGGGFKAVQGGRLILTLKESSYSSFDTEAFKKAHPEMVGNFIRKTSSVRYELKEAV